MKKAAIILGAGASHGSWNEANPLRDPDWKPPLTQELFQTNQRTRFWQILSQYPDAQKLGYELAGAAARNTLNLEERLRKFASSQDLETRLAFRQIPLYLRDLMELSSRAWLQGDAGCYVTLALQLLVHDPHQIAFIVLNYDTLLEQALERVKPQLGITILENQAGDPFDQYVDLSRPAIIVKLHGSANWLAPVCENQNAGGSLSSIGEYLDQIRSADFPAKLAPKFIEKTRGILPHGKGPEGRIEWLPGFYCNRSTGHLLYPVLTAPLAGKSVTDYVCPETHVKALGEFLRDCEKLLIIGTKGWDEDLHDILRQALKGIKIVHYVDKAEREAQETELRFTASVPQLAEAEKLAYNKDFMHYISGEAFKKFSES